MLSTSLFLTSYYFLTKNAIENIIKEKEIPTTRLGYENGRIPSNCIDIAALFAIKLGKLTTFTMDKRRFMLYDICIVMCGSMPWRKH